MRKGARVLSGTRMDLMRVWRFGFTQRTVWPRKAATIMPVQRQRMTSSHR
jgi:hypothetical protein